MRRPREIASGPQRTASEAWSAIATLVGDTLERSTALARADVDAALEHIAGVARMLISGGHLEKSPLVLVAGGLWVEITTVSGQGALTLEENLNPIPGAAGAENWTLYLPQSEPLGKLVREAVAGKPHLSAGEPEKKSNASAGSAVDMRALSRWAGERR